MAEKTFKPPKTLGACADLLYETRQKRLAQQKLVDDLQAQETALKEHIINTMPKSDSGAQGKVARISIAMKEVPQVKDWDAFWKAFKKGRDEDLVQRRLNNTAFQERIEAGKTVAGVEIFKTPTVSLNKL